MLAASRRFSGLLRGIGSGHHDRKRSEQALRAAQAQLAHMARVTTMGELTSSIAHEVNQPLAAVVTNAMPVCDGLAMTLQTLIKLDFR